MEWLGIIVKGLFYGISILFMAPILTLFRTDERHPDVSDLDYDDLGEDLDV